MSEEKLLKFLSDILGEYEEKSNNDVAFFCPFCNHYKKKLEVNLISGKWHCWVCDAKGSSIHILLRALNKDGDCHKKLDTILGTEKFLKDKIVFEKNKLSLPNEFIPLYKDFNSIEYKNAIAYLNRRSINIYDILKYNIGYCETGKYKHNIIIPSYDYDGELNYWIGRDYYKKTNAYSNPKLGKGSKDIIFFEFLINWEQPITIVEGIFDAMTIKRNAIPLLGNIMNESLRSKIVFGKTKDVIIALDSDASKFTIKIAGDLIKNNKNVYIVDLPLKDPSIIGFEKFWEIVKKTNIISESNLIKYKILNL